jgi:hypothetical protein
MKKISVLLIICFVFLPIGVFAQEDPTWNIDGDEAEVSSDEEIVWTDDTDEDFPGDKKEPGTMNRTFEIGLLNFDITVSNDFITLSDIFQETLVINLNNLRNGFNVDFGFFLSPIFFSYNKDDQWGFGLSTKVDVYGRIGLNGTMLTFGSGKDEKSDLNAAAFGEIQLSGFFHIDKFKIKVKPSFYYPFIYMTPNISYTLSNATSGGHTGTAFNMDIGARVYSFFNWETNDFSVWTATLGVDFHLGAEYPLSEVLGLKNFHEILDFDVGIDVINLPMIPATMSDYMEFNVKLGQDAPLILDFFGNNGNLDTYFDMDGVDAAPKYGKQKQNFFRPFKMLFWADWRPFEIPGIFITFKPILGFSINPLYVEVGSFEGGILATLDLGHLFIVRAGIGYYDRLWKNSLDLALNLRAFELDLGISLQAPSFEKSWAGGGLGIKFGMKFGW